MTYFSPFMRRGLSDRINTDDVPEAKDGVLEVVEVSMCIEENGDAHRTKRYELMNRNRIDGSPSLLIVRRGEPFKLKICCSRNFNENRDVVSILLSVQPMNGEKVSHGNRTIVYLPLSKPDDAVDEDDSSWSARLDMVEGNELSVSIRTSAKASVSRWEISIDTKLVDGNDSNNFNVADPIYLLFNPWCEKDPVYLEDEKLREEYVLSDTTMIWRGCEQSFHPTIWKLGQYEKDVLDCSLLLVSTVGRVGASYRGNPVRVTRALSAAVNSNDDNGALAGKWGNDFPDGTAPTAWVGSVNILQEYYRTKRAVRYGQCWVFAGVLATAARALGIPCRVVTNFNSAHDSEASLTIDYYFDDKNEQVDGVTSDSTWNFHVWNEVWMRRCDLGTDAGDLYDGWQAVDATPQELSAGMYKLGPAPVKAIKRGEVNVLYDCDFVFAEVNADEVFWRYKGRNQALKLIRKNSSRIGQFISTKAVGVWEREDITDSYKFKEHTCEERITMMKALKEISSPFVRLYTNEELHDINFEIVVKDDTKIGDPFTIFVNIKNTSEQTAYPVEGIVHIDTVLYTGKLRKPLKSIPFEKTMEQNDTSSLEMHVDFDEYYSHIMDQACFKIVCWANVKGTNYEFFAQRDYRVRKPDINISLNNEPVTGSSLSVTATLQNPMSIPLTNGAFRFECSGVWQSIDIVEDCIEPGQVATVVFSIIPQFAGAAQIAAKFNSTELNDVDGFLAFEVLENRD